MPDKDIAKPEVAAPVDPNMSETTKVEKSAIALIEADIKKAEAEKAEPNTNGNSPEAVKAPAAKTPSRQPRHNADRPTPRQVMHVRGARGTTTRLPPPTRRRERYVDESVPRITVEERRISNDFSYAYFKSKTFLYSDPAQRFFEHNFQRVDGSFLVISLVCGAIGGVALAKRRTDQVEEMNRNLEKQLMRAIDELSRIMTERKIPEEAQVPAYDHKREYIPALHTPQSTQFITLVSLFDRIVARIDAAWFHQIVTPEKRSEMIAAWYRELNGYVSAILALRRETMQEALAAGRRQEARQIEQRVENDKSNAKIEKKDVAVGQNAPKAEAGKPAEAPKTEAPAPAPAAQPAATEAK